MPCGASNIYPQNLPLQNLKPSTAFITMPTALLADDEACMREALREHLSLLWPELTICAEASNGPEALCGIQAHRPDLAFLDIRMPGLDGLQVAHAMPAGTHVVFVTAYNNHAAQAYELDASGYILKPLEPGKVARTLSRIKEKLQGKHPSTPPEALKWLNISSGKTTRVARVQDIAFFEADTKCTRVVGTDFSGHIGLTIKALTETLDATEFAQINRGIIVNLGFVKTVVRNTSGIHIELRNLPDRPKVSGSFAARFRAS
jgi:DNA-binding LytR/AlgR family response regulator